MADPYQDSIVDALKASSAQLFDELLSLTQDAPEELLAKLARANRDENLKVETCGHHEAFANLCLELMLLRVQEVTKELLVKHRVDQESPYLLLLSKHDHGAGVGPCYVFPDRQQLEYFASHGVRNFLASQKTSEAQKKGVLLSLTSNSHMRKVVELTFEMIATDPQLDGYLQDILRSTLILQHTRGHRQTDELTTRLFTLPQRVRELDLAGLLAGSMQQSEVQLVDDIWGEINAAFDVHAEYLQGSGWFVDLHPFTYSFSAEGCFTEETIRDGPIFTHILMCLELVHGDKRDVLCGTTTHLLLPSYRKLDEDKFINAYRVSNHSWALALGNDDHLCLQTIYPEDMPTALEEGHSNDYQSINLDFRSQKMHDKSHFENLKWSLNECWLFLNQPQFANTTGVMINLTVSVNNDTLLQGLVDQLSVNDDNSHFTITFNGGVLYLKELKDYLTRHRMVQFQKAIIKIPDELNKVFVQKGLYKTYPDMIRCLRFLHESEKSSGAWISQGKDLSGHTDPSSKDASSGISRNTDGFQKDGFRDVVLAAHGGRMKAAGSSVPQIQPARKHLASSVVPEPVRREEDVFVDVTLEAQGGWQKDEAQGASNQTLENSKAPRKPRPKLLHKSTFKGIVRENFLNDRLDDVTFHAQGRDDNFDTVVIQSEKASEHPAVELKPRLKPTSSSGTSDRVLGLHLGSDSGADRAEYNSSSKKGRPRIASRQESGDIQYELIRQAESQDDPVFSLEPGKGDDLDTDIPSGKPIDHIAKILHNIGDELKTKQDQDRLTASLAEPDLTCHIGRSVRKLGDRCWKAVLWYQNPGVRVGYTATVAVLTWGAVANCIHLDILPALIHNRKLTLFDSRG